METHTHTLTSESVSEGHPDKVCDYIADSILDAYLTADPRSRVACEVLCKDDQVILAGEISSAAADVDHERIARQAIREVGYLFDGEAFHADRVRVLQFISKQSDNIAQGVDEGRGLDVEQGAGDQGMMFGYATDETPELMPLPIVLAHRLTRGLAEDRRGGRYPWLRPDSKSQVSVEYSNGTPSRVTTVLVSTQHDSKTARQTIEDYVKSCLAPRVLGRWFTPDVTVLVNPTGSFAIGGPSADCGVTGRKIIVDTYGGAAHHGGGAFSGKDPSKVDRSGAYFARYVARQIVNAGVARRAEVQVAYAIGKAQPVSTKVETFGTGDGAAARAVVDGFDFRPAAIIGTLDLLRPIYRSTTNYGHFGKAGLPWEA
ncbi:MAG TPA: methionine adenosyltransferase [Vicinamibacterales bacterium]|nr:methionine adenosyltransferase [Vicinamibacterales bacterium]